MSQDALAELTENPHDEVPRLESLTHTNHEDVINNGAKPEREPVYYTIPATSGLSLKAHTTSASKSRTISNRRSASNFK